MTTIDFETEVRLRGDPNVQNVQFTVMGGTFENRRIRLSKYGPQDSIGARYAIAFSRISVSEGQFSIWPDGMPLIDTTLGIDASIDPADEARLRAEVESFCSSNDIH